MGEERARARLPCWWAVGPVARWASGTGSSEQVSQHSMRTPRSTTPMPDAHICMKESNITLSADTIGQANQWLIACLDNCIGKEYRIKVVWDRIWQCFMERGCDTPKSMLQGSP
eukprot:scaffold19764_cov48-Prasinocladus_malaysianus.AAC.1